MHLHVQQFSMTPELEAGRGVDWWKVLVTIWQINEHNGQLMSIWLDWTHQTPMDWWTEICIAWPSVHRLNECRTNATLWHLVLSWFCNLDEDE